MTHTRIHDLHGGHTGLWIKSNARIASLYSECHPYLVPWKMDLISAEEDPGHLFPEPGDATPQQHATRGNGSPWQVKPKAWRIRPSGGLRRELKDALGAPIRQSQSRQAGLNEVLHNECLNRLRIHLPVLIDRPSSLHLLPAFTSPNNVDPRHRLAL